VWFKVDDGFYSSQKVLSIPRTHRLAAVGLWTMAGNWSGRELSDGVVPAFVLDELGATPRLRQALVEARLWLDHPEGGIEFKNWEDFQPTREQVEADREKTRERQRRHREKKRDEHVSNDDVTRDEPVSHDAPTRPDPTRPKTPPKGGVGSRIPEPFLVTAEMRQWASEEVPAVDVDKATKTFVDYWRAKTGKDATKRDWVATWRNWMRREQPAPTAKQERKVPANDEWMYR
jgi:hypothetical protein